MNGRYRIAANILFLLPGIALHLLFWIYILKPITLSPQIGLKPSAIYRPSADADASWRSDWLELSTGRQGLHQPLMSSRVDKSQSVLQALKWSAPSNVPGPEFMGLYLAARQLMSGYSIYYRPEPAFPDHPEILVTTSNYPVTGILLVAPLLMLPPWTAYLVWLILHQVALIILICCTLSFFKGMPSRWIYAGSWLYSASYHEDLYMGQTSVFMALCILLIGLALVRGNRKLLIMSWTAAMWIKIFPVLWMPVIRRHVHIKRLIAALLFVMVPISAYFMLYTDDLMFFLRRTAGMTQPGDNPVLKQAESVTSAAGGEGLQRLIWNWSRSKRLVRMVSVCIMTLALAVSVLAWTADPLLLIALLISAHFLAFPFVWFHHYLMLLPAFFFLYYRTRNPWVTVLMLCVAISPSRWFLPNLPAVWTLWLIIPTVILFCSVLIKLIRNGKRDVARTQ
jgi:hypothetical protein